MNKLKTRTEPAGTKTNAGSPAKQGLAVGLLAGTLLLSGCGAADDAQPDLSSVSSLNSALTQSGETPRGFAGIGMDMKQMDESDAAKLEPGEGEPDAADDVSANAETKAVRCSHSWRVTLSGIDGVAASNLKVLFGEFTVTGALRNATISESHPASDYEEQWVRPYHTNFRWLGTAPLKSWSTKLVSTSTGKAVFEVKWSHLSVSSADCRAVKEDLKAINDGTDARPLEYSRFAAKGTSYLAGALVGIGATYRIANMAPRAIAGWGAPIGGCLAGAAQLLMQTALEDSWNEHGVETLVDILFNCATGVAGAAVAKEGVNAANARAVFNANQAVVVDLAGTLDFVRNQVPMVRTAFSTFSASSNRSMRDYATRVGNSMWSALQGVRNYYGL